MRVQLNLTIELDDIPDNVCRKLSESEQKIASQLDNIKEHLSFRKVSGSVVATKLIALREAISDFDTAVQEMSQVMQVYENAILQREAAFLKQQTELLQTQVGEEISSSQKGDEKGA